MITMEMFGKVKRMYVRNKKSLREIAKSTGLSRNTVRKWVLEIKQAGRITDPGSTIAARFHSPLDTATGAC